MLYSFTQCPFQNRPVNCDIFILVCKALCGLCKKLVVLLGILNLFTVIILCKCDYDTVLYIVYIPAELVESKLSFYTWN